MSNLTLYICPGWDELIIVLRHLSRWVDSKSSGDIFPHGRILLWLHIRIAAFHMFNEHSDIKDKIWKRLNPNLYSISLLLRTNTCGWPDWKACHRKSNDSCNTNTWDQISTNPGRNIPSMWLMKVAKSWTQGLRLITCDVTKEEKSDY